MSINTLLSRLDKVKKTGGNNWMACCPAHEDRSPSLAIGEKKNGVIVIYCHAGCIPLDILAAVGMEFSDLFPEKLADHISPLRNPFPAADVLEALSTETMIVAMTADRMFNDKDMTVGDWERLRLASQRILAGRSLANG
jgi:hypothetical protein